MRLALALDPSTLFRGSWSDYVLRQQGTVGPRPPRRSIAPCGTIRGTRWCFKTPPQCFRTRGDPEEGVATADLVLRLDPQMPRAYLNGLSTVYFFGRKFERDIELSDQIPEAKPGLIGGLYCFGPQVLLFLAARRTRERAKADLIAKKGEQVMEIWFNEGEMFARTSEQDMEREAFRKLGLRICATEEELKKYGQPKAIAGMRQNLRARPAGRQ